MAGLKTSAAQAQEQNASTKENKQEYKPYEQLTPEEKEERNLAELLGDDSIGGRHHRKIEPKAPQSPKSLKEYAQNKGGKDKGFADGF